MDTITYDVPETPEAEVVVDDKHVNATLDRMPSAPDMRLDVSSDNLVVRVGASAWRVPLPVPVAKRLLAASLVNGVLDVRLERS